MGIWFVLLLLAALFAIALWRGKSGAGTAAQSPEEVLKRRYAAGEIDEKTYEQMLRELRQ